MSRKPRDVSYSHRQMDERPFIAFRRLFGLLAVAGLATGCSGDGSRAAGTLQASAAHFRIEGTILGDKDISTITRGDRSVGIMASDEGAAIQILRFSADGRKAAVVRDVILDPANPELDLEGSAYMDGWFYVTGSHGAARKKGGYQENRARVYRFRLSGASAMPAHVEQASLASILARSDVLGAFHKKPLQERGINIEGLAAQGGNLYFGLRGPNLAGSAFVLRVNAEALFKERKPGHELLRLPLGGGLGIRSMAEFRDGFLLIAGNAGPEPSKAHPVTADFDEDRSSVLFFWRPGRNKLTRLGTFPRVKKGKEEALLVLPGPARAPADILVLYDSIREGGPMRFSVRLPR